jgi:hypothetical protein
MANYTAALTKVLAYRNRLFGFPFGRSKMIGAYLSKLQIQELATNLLALPDGPDGIWFMIGQRGSATSVELIPYKKADTENPIKFFTDSNGVVGGIDIHIGGRNSDSVFDFTITGNGFESVRFHDGVVRHLDAGDLATNPNQRTPPPFSA